MSTTKEYYTFGELSHKLGCDKNMLINLAANGKFPTFIAANNWYGYIWKKPFNEDKILHPDYSTEDLNLGDATLETPPEKPIALNNSLVQLKKSSLVAYQLNKTTNVGAFEARDLINGPEEFIFELRLCNPSDYTKPFEIILNGHEFIVKSYSFKKIESLINSEKSKDVPFKGSERTKFLKIIGLLAILLSIHNKKFKYSDKPNNNQIYEAVENMLDQYKENIKVEFDLLGTGKSSISAAITEGIEKLVKK